MIGEFLAELVRTAESHPTRWWTLFLLAMFLAAARLGKRDGKRRFRLSLSYDFDGDTPANATAAAPGAEPTTDQPRTRSGHRRPLRQNRSHCQRAPKK